MKIFITREIPDAGIILLKKKGFEVSVFNIDRPISRKELLKNISDCDGVISLLTDKIDKEVIDKMKNCKVIANYAVGFNNIEVDHARSKGIVVTNTPDVLTDSTADLAMALVLSCARLLPQAEQFVRAKIFKGWKPKLFLGVELKDKYFGLLGAGRIGAAVAKRAHAFGCKILYFSDIRNLEIEKKFAAKRTSLNSLLKKSDIISIHLPLNKFTYNLLNEDNLTLLKKSAIVINTARGEIIDEKFLLTMLKQNKIASAGFDVYENEPRLLKEYYELNNVVLLPHIGSATFEARNNMSLLAAKNIIAVLSGRKAISPI